MERNTKCLVAEILLIWVMPFLYGAATRLPFIYFVIHLDGHFKLSMLNIGFCVAAYQATRVVTSALSMKLVRVSHVMGTAIGLAGFTTVFVSDNDSLASFVVGTAIEKYAKEMFEKDLTKIVRRKLRHQYASVMIGVVFAFSVGGFVYQYKGINGVALFGIIIESLGLASLFLFFVLTSVKADEEKGESENADPVEASPKEDADAEVQSLPNAEGKGRKRLTAWASTADEQYTTDESFPITWVNWIMVLSFGVEALTIGYNLSIGPIFMLEEFNKEVGIIGVMFAVGAASGSVTAVGVTCTTIGRNALKKIARSPYDICFAIAGIATGVLVAAIPSFPAHVCGVVLLMCFNDLGATLMTELQASITTTSNYSLVGPLGQVVRRSLNVVTALTGPPLFGVFPRLPYFVAGGVTLIWTAGLFAAFKHRVSGTVDRIADATGRRRSSVMGRYSFGAQQSMRAMMKRMSSNKVTRDNMDDFEEGDEEAEEVPTE